MLICILHHNSGLVEIKDVPDYYQNKDLIEEWIFGVLDLYPSNIQWMEVGKLIIEKDT